MDLVRHLKTLLTLEHKFYLKIMHIEGKKNETADGLSRFQMERFRSRAPVQYHPYSWRSECRHQLLSGPFNCSINQRDLFLGQKEFSGVLPSLSTYWFNMLPTWHGQLSTPPSRAILLLSVICTSGMAII